MASRVGMTAFRHLRGATRVSGSCKRGVGGGRSVVSNPARRRWMKSRPGSMASREALGRSLAAFSVSMDFVRGIDVSLCTADGDDDGT